MAETLSESTLQRAAECIALLRTAGETVATAESLTSGLCAAALTSVPGSSAAVRGGVIVYATDLKGSLAGVPESVLAEHGPVSELTAWHLARGACRAARSDWGVALTGVAGPDMQDGHAVGTVYVAVHHAGGSERTDVELLNCHGDRTAIRDQAVAGSLALLVAGLREHLVGVSR